jgi:hypothetical protein
VPHNVGKNLIVDQPSKDGASCFTYDFMLAVEADVEKPYPPKASFTHLSRDRHPSVRRAS